MFDRVGYLMMSVVLAMGCGDDGSKGGGDAGTAQDAASDGGDAGDDVSSADIDVDAEPEPLPVVTEDGPFAVGFGEWSVTYTPAGADRERTMRVVYWYPTLEDDGDPGLYMGLLRRTEVNLDAAIAPGGPYPLMMFSHGSGGIAEQSWYLTEYLASHGWLVVAPEHTGNTTFDNANAFHENLDWRPQDISAVLDALAALDESHPLNGQIGTPIAVTGHSFGGYTSLAVAGASFEVEPIDAQCTGVANAYCDYWRSEGVRDRFTAGFGDERIELTIPMAPAHWATDLSTIEVPVLLADGALDATLLPAEHANPLWEGLTGSGHMRLDFATAGHFTFANACELAGSFLGANDGCGEGFISPEDAHEVLKPYTLAFLRSRLQGDAPAEAFLVSDPSNDDVTVSFKE